MNKKKIEERLINIDNSLINALKIMDKTGFRSLLVINDYDLFAGILSIGDIQRAIINNISLDSSISGVLRSNPRIALKDTTVEQIKTDMLRYRMEFMPVISESNAVETVIFWEELFLEQKLPPRKQFDLPVVIMAGGEGTRLKPLTNVLPKPLMPIGERTIIEEIFDRFGEHGCNEFFISVNYKADLIEFYLKKAILPYNLKFYKEDKPMGTSGSLSLLKREIDKTFFVSNCDILIEQDYSEILDFHRQNNNEITIVAVIKNYSIPYGVIKSGDNGVFLSIQEKPEFTFMINSGMYILEPHILNEIPENDFFYITQLIEKVKSRNGSIGVFPVNVGSWKDIGNWDEYDNIINGHKR